MLKGLTVWYLLHKTFKVEPHHRVLIHAAAGGIGLLACQWARALGAHVIGTVGSKAKADLALANGCDHVILYNEEDFVARVKQISRNELCDVVYDGVGKSTFPGSLSCLKPRGLFVSFGNASGPVPPFAIAELNNHGSLFATRPKLNDYIGTRKELLEGADTLFAAVINGKLHVPINHAYALKDAAQGAYRPGKPQHDGRVDPEAVAESSSSERSDEQSMLALRSRGLLVASLRNDELHYATRRAAPALVRIASRPSIISAISSRVTLSAGMKRSASGCGELSSRPASSACATIAAPIGSFRSSASSRPRPRTSPRPCRAESFCSSLSR